MALKGTLNDRTELCTLSFVLRNKVQNTEVLQDAYRPYQSILALFVVLFFNNLTTQPDVQLTGTWEARFSGKV
jgi:hypothetical protein